MYEIFAEVSMEEVLKCGRPISQPVKDVAKVFLQKSNKRTLPGSHIESQLTHTQNEKKKHKIL